MLHSRSSSPSDTDHGQKNVSLSVPPFLTGQLQSVCVGFPYELSAAAAEENAAPEVVEVMDAVTAALQDLDLVVQSFAGPVRPAIFSAVLDVRAVVPDRVGAPPGALMGGGGISVKPVGKHTPPGCHGTP